MIINPSLHKIKITNLMGLDLETSGLSPLNHEPLVIALSNEDRETFVLEVGKYNKIELKFFLERLLSCERVIAHNAKFDGNFLYKHFGILYRNWYDSYLSSQILNNGKQFVHSLPNVISFYTGKQYTFEDKKGMQMSFVGMSSTTPCTKEQLEYAGEDTKFLIDVYHKQMHELKLMKLHKVERLESKLLPVLIKMECEGCLIDVDKWLQTIEEWKTIKVKYEKQLDELIKELSHKYEKLRGGVYTRERRTQEVEVLDLFGQNKTISNKNVGNVNYGSSSQILDIFDAVGEKAPLNKDGNPSVGEDNINTFVNENPKSDLIPFLYKLIEYREYNKLISTYGASFLDQLDENKYIHTSYTQCSTTTGRLSSHGPNLQNIPGGRSAGGAIRNFFIARPGYKMITCDMNSAEVAIAADYSGEKLLLDSIIEGADMHSELASVSFSIIFGQKFQVSKSEDPVKIKGYEFIPVKLRTDHKYVLFAKFYKAGAKRVYTVLSKYINLLYDSEKERMEIARKVSNALDKKMPTLSEFLTKQIDSANTAGYLRGSKLGRIRYWPDKNAYGDAANMPIQNTNAEAMKIALIKIDEYLDKCKYGRLVMNIHDEAVVEAKEDKVEEVAAKVQQIVADSLSWFLKSVKGGSSVNIQPYWEK